MSITILGVEIEQGNKYDVRAYDEEYYEKYEYERPWWDSVYEEEEYDYFQESRDDDLRKGCL